VGRPSLIAPAVRYYSGALRASNDADVSTVPPIIPYDGFSQYGWKGGMSDGVLPKHRRLKPAPGLRGRLPFLVRLVHGYYGRESALSESVRESVSAHASSKSPRHRVRSPMDMPSRGSTRTPLAACRIFRALPEVFHRGKACISAPGRHRSCTALGGAEV
jgi:hypothetical protein